jgi:hypothetical protein
MADPAPAAPKLMVGFCDLCTPVRPLAVGVMPAAPKHLDPMGKSMHQGKMVEIDSKEQKLATESNSQFIVRMVEKYVTKK